MGGQRIEGNVDTRRCAETSQCLRPPDGIHWEPHNVKGSLVRVKVDPSARGMVLVSLAVVTNVEATLQDLVMLEPGEVLGPGDMCSEGAQKSMRTGSAVR